MKWEENLSMTWNEIFLGFKLEVFKSVWKSVQQLETALAEAPLTRERATSAESSKITRC